MKQSDWAIMRERALAYYQRAHIVLTDAEKDALEIADFGLDDIERTGLQLITYVNTELCCAKEMVLFPRQTCPEHTHRPLPNGFPGKEETFRCRYGSVYLYVEGEPTQNRAAAPPAGDEAYYTVFHEVVLLPGDQYTLVPDTKHWFQAGDKGAVISEFSTKSRDEYDLFTDPRIVRETIVEAEEC